ncbi:hypothetical protein BDW02DRAFT_621012 [Decorospora gaudefroyi]|uniref:DNA recombination and repair protein Rad51-like C-terminal domain-containing protein n=1 Tax=Decorospora gaudefroyi TaxID=184978 RepID=A0A6A5KGL6_9PLEO|nr:hypothetical protein BDW02DRAFT_621012 [Decorospora gaudefroyi]
MSDRAKRLGGKLLMEVGKVEDLSSVPFTCIPPLATLLQNPNSPTQILELISPPTPYHPSPAGKTSLLQHIIAHALLPSQESAIILIDPLSHFSVPRLTSILLHHLKSTTTTTKDWPEMKATVKTALSHVHIFRPQTWPSLLATLTSLPTYLFDAKKHASMNRRIHSICLEDIDTFIWSIRTNSSSSFHAVTNPLATASSQLTRHLTKLSSLLSCAILLTSRSSTPSTFRPLLPLSWPPGTPLTRLAVRRVDVGKFAPAISGEEAEVEREKRWSVVRRARFECWRVGAGRVDGLGFVFRVGDGVEIEN